MVPFHHGFYTSWLLLPEVAALPGHFLPPSGVPHPHILTDEPPFPAALICISYLHLLNLEVLCEPRGSAAWSSCGLAAPGWSHDYTYFSGAGQANSLQKGLWTWQVSFPTFSGGFWPSCATSAAPSFPLPSQGSRCAPRFRDLRPGASSTSPLTILFPWLREHVRMLHTASAARCREAKPEQPSLDMLSGPRVRTTGARQGEPSAQYPHPTTQGGRLTTALRVRGIRALRWSGGCQRPTLPQSSFSKDLLGNTLSP